MTLDERDDLKQAGKQRSHPICSLLNYHFQPLTDCAHRRKANWAQGSLHQRGPTVRLPSLIVNVTTRSA